MKRAGLVAACISIVALGLGGCPTWLIRLNPTQRGAVDAVGLQLKAAAGALATLSVLANPELDLDVIHSYGSIAGCPAVSYAVGATNIAIVVSFDPGCAGPGTGGKAVYGSHIVYINRSERSATVALNNLKVDGKPVSGSLNVTIENAANGVTLTGIADLTTEGAGTLRGSLTVNLGGDGVLTLSSSGLLVTKGSATYAVSLTDLVIDPVQNRSFAPEGGTAEFQGPASQADGTPVTFTLTFGSNSPTGGMILLATDNAGPMDYQIVGLGG